MGPHGSAVRSHAPTQNQISWQCENTYVVRQRTTGRGLVSNVSTTLGVINELSLVDATKTAGTRIGFWDFYDLTGIYVSLVSYGSWFPSHIFL